MKQFLDTNIILYLLGGRLASPLPKGRCFVSVITEIELLSYHSLDTRSEMEVRRFLSNIHIVLLTPTVKETAIRLRRQYSIKVPDAIISASALIVEAELLTNDMKLVNIPELRCKRIPLK